VIKDDAEEDTYSMSDKMNEDSDTTVTMKDDARRNTNSHSGDAMKVKRNKMAKTWEYAIRYVRKMKYTDQRDILGMQLIQICRFCDTSR
jgi:hypothetical protein